MQSRAFSFCSFGGLGGLIFVGLDFPILSKSVSTNGLLLSVYVSNSLQLHPFKDSIQQVEDYIQKKVKQ
jgi:hypothetical protein